MDFLSDNESFRDDKSEYNETDRSFSGPNIDNDNDGKVNINDNDCLNVDDPIKNSTNKLSDAEEVVNELKEDLDDLSIENFNRNNLSSSDYDEKGGEIESNLASARVQSDGGDDGVLELNDHEKTIKDKLVGNYNSDVWRTSLNEGMYQGNYEVLTISADDNDAKSQHSSRDLNIDVEEKEIEETGSQAPDEDEEEEEEGEEEEEEEEEEEDDEETENNDDDLELLLNQPFIKYSKLVKEDKLDLSNMNISSLDNSLLELTSLTRLNLSHNKLKALLDNIFECLPGLKWLDVRNNVLECLPWQGLMEHEALQVLLLDDNNLRGLPLHLGFVTSLKAIGIKGNPLTEIPEEVKSKGVNEIKKYLKNSYTNQLSETGSEIDLNKENNTQNNNANGGDESVDDNTKIKLFKSLHHKKFAMNKNHNNKKQLQTQSDKYILDKYGEPVEEEILVKKFREELQKIKIKKEKERQNSILESVTHSENIHEWKEAYKEGQMMMMHQKMVNGGFLEYDHAAENAPFGVADKDLKMISNEERIYEKMTNETPYKPQPVPLHLKMRLQQAKLSHENHLKKLAREHLNHVREQKYDGMQPSEIIQATKKDLDMALRLQDEIQKKQRELEYGMSNVPPNIFN